MKRAFIKGVKGIGVIEYEKKDIVRHPLVQRIVDAYEKREKEEPEDLIVEGWELRVR